MYTATLTFTKTEDGRVRLDWSDHDPLSVFVVADSAPEALRLIADTGDFEGQWLDQEADELSTSAEPVEPDTLGLARRVAVAPDDIKALIEDNIGNGNLLRIDYRDREDVLTTNRLIEPKFTDYTPITGRTYLRAYDFGREARRTFNVANIERAELVEDGV